MRQHGLDAAGLGFEACKAQQMGEGWFPTINDVPQQAISMGIQQILKSKFIDTA